MIRKNTSQKLIFWNNFFTNLPTEIKLCLVFDTYLAFVNKNKWCYWKWWFLMWWQNTSIVTCHSATEARQWLTSNLSKAHKTRESYSSSCSQVIVVYLHPFRRNSFFCSQKSPKNRLKSIFLGFKVVQGHRCWWIQKACHQCLLW